MRVRHRVLLCAVAFFVLVDIASAQVTTGTPEYGSFGGGPDVINLANLNSNLTVPIRHKAGRGSNFDYSLTYDSSIWQPVTIGSTKSWQPTGQWGWGGLQSAGQSYITYSIVENQAMCYNGGPVPYTEWDYSNFVYHDQFGNTHVFPDFVQYFQSPGGSNCPPNGAVPSTPQASYDSSGGGLTLYVTPTIGQVWAYLVDKNGTVISPPVSTVPPTQGSSVATDRNGNKITSTNGVYTDTLNQTVLSVISTPPSTTTLSYTAPSGSSAAYTVSYLSHTVRTNFNCAGVGEYNSGSTPVYLVDKITLPDSSFYQLAYETTPGFPSDVTGRVASITLPTGGTISYLYSGGGTGVNGVTCADGSAATLQRTTPDGVWTYAHSESGTTWTTTITDPQNNYTVAQFQRIFETLRQVYQGAVAPANLLQTVTTCYDGVCPSTTPPIAVNQRAVTIQLGNGGLQCKHVYSYDFNYDRLTEQDDYDYASGPPTTILRKTLIAYAPLGNGINNSPASVTIQDGSGTTKAKTSYTYDQGTVATSSGTPQHVAITGARGNATTIATSVTGTTTLSRSLTYYDTGTVKTSSDVNGAVTTLNYPDSNSTCGNAFATSITEPLGLSKSMTWSCAGGVQLTAKDENGQTTTTTYNDQHFWRPASVTDQLTNVDSFAYSASNPPWVSESLTFNSNHSIAETGRNLDGLGRQIAVNHLQAPGANAWDQVTYSYDSNGRLWKTSVPCVSTGAWTCPNTATTTTYDALNRPLLTTDGGGGTINYSYPQNDVLVAVGPPPTGENTKRRQLEYDALGRLTSVCEVTSGTGSGACGQRTAQTGFWTKYTYDAVGNLTGVTENAQSSPQTRTYMYDLMGRLTSETNPESGTTSYSWDSATGTSCSLASSGDMIKRVDANGHWTCYNYDALHRLFDVGNSNQSASNPCKRFRYDNTAGMPGSTKPPGITNTLGRLAEVETDFNGVITDEWFSYTARGEVSDLYELTPHSGGYSHTTASYWANGAVNLLTAPGGYSAAYNLDGEGRVYSTAPSVNALSSTLYNAASQPTQITYASSDSDTFTYDPHTSRMTQYKFNVNGQSVIGNLTWNSIGTLASLAITDPFNSANAQTCNYSHDDLTRIASVSCGAAKWQQNFSYDSFGNITKTVPTGGTGYSFQPTYSTTTNRMTSIGGSTPSYDASGNVLNDFLHNYTWDVYGRPVTIDGVSVTYDALGRMVEQNRSGAYSEIAYAPTGTKIEIMNGQSFTKAFVPLPGGAVAVYTPSLEYYRHPDHLGSSRFASTTSRTMYSDVAYAPFGEPYAQAGSTDLSFTGMNQDTVSNLYDFPAREYGIQGRWPSPDPAGLAAVDPTKPQSWNRYAYLLNNPLSSVDPLGLCGEDNPYGFDDYVSCDDEGDPSNGGGIGSPSSPGSSTTFVACTGFCAAVDASISGPLNAGAQPNLASMFNEGPGGYSYGGVDTLVALDCAAENNPADNGCFGVKLSLSGGLLQGSWSLGGYADDANRIQSIDVTVPLPGVFSVSLAFTLTPPPPPDPLNPDQLVNLKPSPLPNPTSRSYVCPMLVTQIRQVQMQSAGNPSIAQQLAGLQAMYQKSCQ